MADDVGNLGHEFGHFCPFIRQQVLLELRMDGPLRINTRSFPTDEHSEQFNVPCRSADAVLRGWISVRLS